MNCPTCNKTISRGAKSCLPCFNQRQKSGEFSFVYERTPEHREMMSKRLKGRKFTDVHKKNISKSHLGKPIKKRSTHVYSKQWLIGKLRTSLQARRWKREVLVRDGFACKICGKSGGRLDVDHIVPFSFVYREAVLTENFSFLYDIENGRTLCRNCHKKTDTYAKKARNDVHNKIFDALFVRWKQLGEPETFKIYYDKAVEHFINEVKAKLE